MLVKTASSPKTYAAVRMCVCVCVYVCMRVVWICACGVCMYTYTCIYERTAQGIGAVFGVDATGAVFFNTAVPGSSCGDAQAEGKIYIP